MGPFIGFDLLEMIKRTFSKKKRINQNKTKLTKCMQRINYEKEKR